MPQIEKYRIVQCEACKKFLLTAAVQFKCTSCGKQGKIWRINWDIREPIPLLDYKTRHEALPMLKKLEYLSENYPDQINSEFWLLCNQHKNRKIKSAQRRRNASKIEFKPKKGKVVSNLFKRDKYSLRITITRTGELFKLILYIQDVKRVVNYYSTLLEVISYLHQTIPGISADEILKLREYYE